MKTSLHGQVIVRAVGVAALVVLCYGTTKFTRSAPRAQADSQQAQPLKVATDSLPQAVLGEYYGITIYASVGKRPYDFSATGLPDGLSISRNSDRIAGMPKAAGTSTVVITVEDSAQPTPNKASATLKLTVVAAPGK